MESLLLNTDRDLLVSLLIYWLVLLGVLLWRLSSEKRSSGLPLAYAFSLTLLHWFGAFIYAQPTYHPMSDMVIQAGLGINETYRGFFLACIGFTSFSVAVLAGPFIFRKPPKIFTRKPVPDVSSKLPGTLLMIAFTWFFFIGPIIRRIPSMTSINGSGTLISVIGVLLACRMAYMEGNQRKFLKWLGMTGIFPFITILLMGFAASGMQAAQTVWMMILKFYRPRWLASLCLAFVMYVVLTLYVNYMRERMAIRSSVWGQQQMSNRLDKLYRVFTKFEFLSLRNNYQLEAIDGRLNQNGLVGQSVNYINSGRIEFARGGTLVAAVAAIVPRILWPNKPVTGGSGSVVSRYTGMKFGEGTSVGVGPVMEFYINYGMTGVCIGFFILGLIWTWLDLRAGFYLEQGDLWNFTRWAVPALGLLQAGGSLAEAVGATAAGFVFVIILHNVVFKKFYEQEWPVQSNQQVRGSRVERVNPHQTQPRVR